MLYFKSREPNEKLAEAFGDIKNVWQAGGMVYKGKVTREQKTSFFGDVKVLWGAGGVRFFCYDPQEELPDSFGDIAIYWVVGGLKYKSYHPKTLAPSVYGDIFILKYVTLVDVQETFNILLTVEQPYGIPWMQTEVVHAAWCWRITREDGVVLGFTSHDEDISYNGVTYKASTGFAPTAVSASGDMSVDNLDAEGILKDGGLTTADLRKGLYNNAAIEVFLINYTNLKDEVFILRRGYLGEVTYGRNGFTAEIKGLMEAYQQQVGKVCQKTCRTNLGSKECGIYLPSFTVSGTVIGIKEDGTFTINAKFADDFFSYGIITWTGGLNAGSKMEVKKYESNGRVQLFLPMNYNVSIGDTFSIVAGCDGNATTCKKRFNNLVNFRGEPYVIGNSYAASYPVESSNNIVSEGQDTRVGAYKWD